MSEHIYHYNVHSEQRYFVGPEHRGLYDLIFLNGNIVSHTPAGIAAFLATTAKDFYIDPQTHIFQHNTIHLKRDNSDASKGETPDYQFKPSIIKLAQERLGEPFSLVIEQDRPLSPPDFFQEDGSINQERINSICENVVNFQKDTMYNSLDDESRELLSENVNFRPKFIIAPYFFLSPIRFSNWLNITKSCYLRTKEIVTDLQVFFVLVVSKEALDSGIDDIVGAVSEINADGIIIWIDEHTEEDLSIRELKRFIALIRGLRNSTGTIHNSHGGYFSIMLCHSEFGNLLNGVGHSINYGESRSVVPVGGGIPMARFYFPSIHSRIRFGDALGIVTSKNWLTSIDEYRAKICSCLQCAKLIEENNTANEVFYEYGRSFPVTIRRRSGSIVSLEYPTKEAKQAAACHYLYNKAREFEDIQNKPLNELVENLRHTYDEIAPYSGEAPVAHLNNWSQVLQELLT